MKVAISTLIFALSVGAYAATDSPSGKASGVKTIVKYKKVTELDFDDSLIKGKLVRPDGDLLLHQKREAEDHWLKLRSSFKERIVRSKRRLPQ